MVTNEEDVRKEIQELVANKADFVKVWQDSRRELMPRPVIEFLIAEAHRNHLGVAVHSHALSDFKHLRDPGSSVRPLRGARRIDQWTMTSRCSRHIRTCR